MHDLLVTSSLLYRDNVRRRLVLSGTYIDAYRTFHVCKDCQFGLNFKIIVLIKIRYVKEINFNCNYGLKDAVILLLRNFNDIE